MKCDLSSTDLRQLGAQRHLQSLYSHLHGQHVVVAGGSPGSMADSTLEKHHRAVRGRFTLQRCWVLVDVT